MYYEKVLGEHKFPTYEELKNGLLRLIDEGKISREDAARLLPELRESEDERIIKTLQDYVKNRNWRLNGPTQDEVLAWLEKQKEQKPNYCHHEVDETGWTEEYRKAYYDGWNNCNQQHAQLQAEQKPIDDGTRGKIISRAKSEKQVILISESSGNAEIGWDTRSLEDAKKLLEYGLAFINKQLDVKSAVWSEEDKDYYDTIVRKLEVVGDDSGLSDNQIKFLREHCPLHCLEWSEEDENKIERLAFLVSVVEEKEMISPSESVDLRNFIKSVRPQPHWKPSEEQISSLKQARDYYMSGRIKYVGRHLSEIAEQLEKLM